MNSVQGKRVLLTGASGGIGQATVIALTENGAKVIGLDVVASDTGIPILSCDITSEEQIKSAVAAAADQLGGIDVVVNNAGILQESALSDVSSAHIDQMFAVNVKGTILVTQEVLPYLPDGGRIINIASELAYLGREYASVYVATKAAVVGLTRSWARELAPRVLVMPLRPGQPIPQC